MGIGDDFNTVKYLADKHVGEIPSGNWRLELPVNSFLELFLLEKYPVGIGDYEEKKTITSSLVGEIPSGNWRLKIHLSVFLCNLLLEKYPVGIGDSKNGDVGVKLFVCWRNTQWELATS